jgi:hypothetical protein
LGHAKEEMTAMPTRFAFAIFACVLLALSPAMAADGEVVATGTFTGKSNHRTNGSVAVHKTASGYTVELGSDFDHDGAPDPKLGFGRDGYDAAAKFSPLRANTGAQSYKIPAKIDAESYTEVWVWCEKYSVPLGVAKLKPAQ